MKIAHIIKVTEINDTKKASYLHIAQPVTLKSMVAARNHAQGVVDVDLVAIKHKDEQVSIPDEFRWATDLDQYAWQHFEALRKLSFHRPLPRLTDLITGLYQASDSEYLIYTNLDIGLQPHFYRRVREIIDQGHDAFCINRRDLPKDHEGVLLDQSNLELACAMEGTSHPGIDCFVFNRELVPLLSLGNVYIGFPPVGRHLKTQIEKYASNFTWIKNEQLTFHLGSDRAWQNKEDPYYQENFKESDRFGRPPNVRSFTRRLGSRIKSLLSKVLGKF